jgi:hypothetical protein
LKKKIAIILLQNHKVHFMLISMTIRTDCSTFITFLFYSNKIEYQTRPL